MITKYKLLGLCILFLFVTAFNGCSGRVCCALPNTKSTLIKYVNQTGEDLLNPKHSHAITKQNIDLYYLNNGKRRSSPNQVLVSVMNSVSQMTII